MGAAQRPAYSDGEAVVLVAPHRSLARIPNVRCASRLSASGRISPPVSGCTTVPSRGLVALQRQSAGEREAQRACEQQAVEIAAATRSPRLGARRSVARPHPRRRLLAPDSFSRDTGVHVVVAAGRCTPLPTSGHHAAAALGHDSCPISAGIAQERRFTGRGRMYA
jgi:hypothetical protein